MSISSVSTSSPSTYQYTPTTATTGTTSTSSPVVASNDPGLAQQVSALSTTAGVVATLGTASSSDALTYDAAGLYNSIAQAGTSTTAASTTASTGTAASGSDTASTATPSLDSSILSAAYPTTSASSVASGFYTGSGVLQSDTTSGSNLTANWANALKENPNLSSNVAADSYAQGIVGTLSTTA